MNQRAQELQLALLDLDADRPRGAAVLGLFEELEVGFGERGAGRLRVSFGQELEQTGRGPQTRLVGDACARIDRDDDSHAR